MGKDWRLEYKFVREELDECQRERKRLRTDRRRHRKTLENTYWELQGLAREVWSPKTRDRLQTIANWAETVLDETEMHEDNIPTQSL